MTRALFWLALIILIVFAVRSKMRKLHRGQGDNVGSASGPRQLDQGEPMACCAHCHLYFPASEAVHAGALDYCCAAHVGLPGQ